MSVINPPFHLKVTYPAGSRLGQAIYSAIHKSIKTRGNKITDSAIMDKLHSISDTDLLKLLAGEV